MKKILRIPIAIIILLGVGFLYLVKNPEGALAQKILPTFGIEKSTPTGPNTITATTPENIRVGMPNPASRNCERKGGTTEIVEGTGGQVGMCVFSDGTKCEEWAYLRGECGTSASGIDTGNKCPLRTQPGPGFCSGGKIIPGEKDSNGCQLPPLCQKK